MAEVHSDAMPDPTPAEESANYDAPEVLPNGNAKAADSDSDIAHETIADDLPEMPGLISDSEVDSSNDNASEVYEADPLDPGNLSPSCAGGAAMAQRRLSRHLLSFLATLLT